MEGRLLTPARRGHPWTGWSFSAGWGTRETLNVTFVRPELVVEVSVDVARAAGLWRHPARLHHPRTDLSPTDVPLLSLFLIVDCHAERRVSRGA